MSETPEKSNGNVAKLIVILVLLAGVGILIYSNMEPTTLNFLGMPLLAMPGWVWMVVLLVVGVIIGSLFPWFRPKKK